MTDEEIRNLLREMREEPVPADSLARLRMAVYARRSAKSRLPWFAALLASAAALAFLFLLLRPAKVSVPVAVKAIPSAPAVVEAVQAPVAAKVTVVRRSKPKAKPQVEMPVLVRIETEDPDVVILLIGD